jgi:predicted DNA-binding transcriptional regulator AlpA
MDTPSGRLTAKQTATYVGLSTSTLAKMRMSGSGPSYHKLGRKVVYDISDIDTWLAAQRVSTAEVKVIAGLEGM